MITNNLRNDFPMILNNPQMIYLDSAATSLKPTCVINKINEYYTKYGVNVHRGVYDLSAYATKEYEETRNVVASFINCKPCEVIYTKGATNSLNMVKEMLKPTLKAGDEVIASVLEHHSAIMPWQQLAIELKLKLTYMPLDDANHLTLDNLKKTITPKTKVLLIPYVSNVLGVMAPVKELTKIAHEHNIYVICDAAQAAPHMPIDVKDLDVDFLAFSGHKMLGPMGSGILYGKYNLLQQLNPVEFGGDMNDGVEKFASTFKDAPEKYEAGTPIIDAVIGLKEAINYLNNVGMINIQNHEKALAQMVYDELKDHPMLEIYTINPESGIFTFNIKGIHPHDVATYLATKGISVRAGHHCAQLITNYLGCMGNVRASFYLYNTKEDALALACAIKDACNYFKEWL